MTKMKCSCCKCLFNWDELYEVFEEIFHCKECCEENELEFIGGGVK